jgi:hypothetical protein
MTPWRGFEPRLRPPAFLDIAFQSGLPDGIFSNQESQFREFLEAFAMQDVGIFYGHLVYVMAFW